MSLERDETIQAVNLNSDDARLLQVDSAAGLLVTAIDIFAGDIPWQERTLPGMPTEFRKPTVTGDPRPPGFVGVLRDNHG